jgi:RNA polymerase sigma-70 factor (ECF subfamily)
MWTRVEVEALYRKTSFSIFQRCRSLLREDAEAKDVAQEVYVHLLAHPEQFRGDATPATYLYAVATNKSLSRLRARRLRGDVWQEAVGELLRGARLSHDPEKMTEARAILATALASADDVTAAMLVYHYVDGLTQGEIAEIMNLSRVTVNQRLARFRQQALAIADGGEDEDGADAAPKVEP